MVCASLDDHEDQRSPSHDVNCAKARRGFMKMVLFPIPATSTNLKFHKHDQVLQN